MMDTLSHRGPDSRGSWTSADGQLTLGHLRLAIVDLTIEGAQPMRSRSGRYWIVFNGEIYNHLELRKALPGATWRGHSDTETLLEGIDQWGLVKTLQACVGMFAIGLWDTRQNTLALARDRMGEKPLYVGRGRDTLAFASELKAMRDVPGLDLSLDSDALRQYARLGYIPAPASAYRSVQKLLPGTILTLRSPLDEGTSLAYWTLPRPSGQHQPGAGDPGFRSESDWISIMSDALDTTVSEQLLGDVPLGAFLSGGIDSSLIVARMQRASSQPVRTFSMGVHDALEDESEHARLIAQHLGTSHTRLMVTPDDVLGVVPDLVRIYDEPFADSSQIPTVLLSRLTRAHVTVALSGDAGDELFGGYNRHLIASRLEPTMHSMPAWLRRATGACLNVVPASAWNRLSTDATIRRFARLPPGLGEKISRVSALFAAESSQQAYQRMVSQWLDENAIPVRALPASPNLPICEDVSLAQQMMWWDMQTYLPDDILVKVDRAAMSCSLETRVPFLDHRIVELALALPMKYKIRQGTSKWMLRQLLARDVPTSLTDRPKQGFTLPLAQWLRGPLRDWAEELLQPASLDRSGIWLAEQIRAIWQEHLSGRFNHQRALWTVLMLQAWLNNEAAR